MGNDFSSQVVHQDGAPALSIKKRPKLQVEASIYKFSCWETVGLRFAPPTFVRLRRRGCKSRIGLEYALTTKVCDEMGHLGPFKKTLDYIWQINVHVPDLSVKPSSAR
jgi:hypothetical protein